MFESYKTDKLAAILIVVILIFFGYKNHQNNKNIERTTAEFDRGMVIFCGTQNKPISEDAGYLRKGEYIYHKSMGAEKTWHIPSHCIKG